LAARKLLTVFAVDQVKIFVWLASWLPAEPASITTCTGFRKLHPDVMTIGFTSILQIVWLGCALVMLISQLPDFDLSVLLSSKPGKSPRLLLSMWVMNR
jgi:hypothetical protein